jgi:hypothetical protein
MQEFKPRMQQRQRGGQKGALKGVQKGKANGKKSEIKVENKVHGGGKKRSADNGQRQPLPPQKKTKICISEKDSDMHTVTSETVMGNKLGERMLVNGASCIKVIDGDDDDGRETPPLLEEPKAACAGTEEDTNAASQSPSW